MEDPPKDNGKKKPTYQEVYNKVWNSPPSKRGQGFFLTAEEFNIFFPLLPPLVRHKRKYSPLKNPSPVKDLKKGKETCAAVLDFGGDEGEISSIGGWYDKDHWWLGEEADSQLVAENSTDLTDDDTCSSDGSILVDDTPKGKSEN